MSEDFRDPETAALETVLAALVPLADLLDRDQLVFRAGQASVARRGWAWPCTSAILAVLAVTFATALVLRPAPQPVERIVSVKEPAPPAPVPEHPARPEPQPPQSGPLIAGNEQAQAEYLKLRRQVLEHGVDALPQPPPLAKEQTLTMESLLELPPGTLGRSRWLPRDTSSTPGGPL